MKRSRLNTFPILWLILLALSFAPTFPALAQDGCPSVVDDSYTLYVYADSDAKVLLDQKCETPNGDSQLEKTLSDAIECRCYDKKVSDVLQKLISGGGPIAVTTRKLMSIGAGVTCKVALLQCEQACVKAAKAAPEPCAAVQTAGISLY